jgi:hypothetical protein
MIPTLTERRPLLRATSFSIACKRWSRFSGSSGGLLPCLVDFQLQGIPVHAWEASTAAQLLSPFAWIRSVHPAMSELATLADFRCTAWVRSLDEIPRSRDLWIVEPPSI